jgi:hypothetical protein
MIVKLFSETRGVTWRASCGLLTGALALASAACAGGGATAMSPSAATSANLNASCGDTGGLRKFRMTVTPDTLPTPGPAKITVVITNDATSNCNQGLGSAQFTVPAGLNFVSIDSMTVSGGKAWSNSVNGSTILVGANNGTQKLVPSESVTLVLNVNPTACGVNTFDVAVATAWTAPFSGVKTDTFGYLGMAPKVTVTGCAPAPTVSCTDRHAPAVANDYVRNVLGIAPKRDPRIDLRGDDPRNRSADSRGRHLPGTDPVSAPGLRQCGDRVHPELDFDALVVGRVQLAERRSLLCSWTCSGANTLPEYVFR